MKSFLKIAAVLVGVGVILVIALLTYFYFYEKEKCAEVAKKQNTFPVSQLRLSNLEIMTGGIEVRGRLTNQSALELFGFSVEVVAEDCNIGSCTIVGKHIFSLNTVVPSGEARDFQNQQFLGNPLTQIQPRGAIRYKASIWSVDAVPQYEQTSCAGRF